VNHHRLSVVWSYLSSIYLWGAAAIFLVTAVTFFEGLPFRRQWVLAGRALGVTLCMLTLAAYLVGASNLKPH
jgi:hypothetical protein